MLLNAGEAVRDMAGLETAGLPTDVRNNAGLDRNPRGIVADPLRNTTAGLPGALGAGEFTKDTAVRIFELVCEKISLWPGVVEPTHHQ